MKPFFTIKIRSCHLGVCLMTIIFFLALLFTPGYILSQEGKAPKKTKARVRLSFSKNEAGLRYIDGKVTTKVEKRWQAVEGITIGIYRDSVSENTLIKEVETNQDGIGRVEIPAHIARVDSSGFMNIVGVINPNKRHRVARRSLEVKDLNLTVECLNEDSIGTVRINASEMNFHGKAVPVEDLDVNIYVKRTFSLLKIGEGETDKNGNLEVAIPQDIPGDKHGFIEIISKIEDHDEYGTIVASCEADCGIPLKTFESNLEKRKLWSPNAPLWMVITFGILMTVVWGHFYFFVYLLFRIKRLGTKNPDKKLIWED